MRYVRLLPRHCTNSALCISNGRYSILFPRKTKPRSARNSKCSSPWSTPTCPPLAAYENLHTFARRWGKKYPSLARLGNERNAAYFNYLRFSEKVRRMIYSTNRVERLNRCYKRTLLMRGAMPSPASVVYLLGAVAKKKTEGTYARRLPYFREWKIR